MKNRENICNPDVLEAPAKNSTLKYILIAVLLIGGIVIWWWQSNSNKSGNASAVNSDSVTTTSATGNIYEPDMVTVQGGMFAMGGKENTNEKPIHNVTLASFKIAKYETTLAQWQKVMGSNPAGREDCMDCPVTAVGWDDVQTFIKKLNTLSGKNYRLPTEAEWEYAARGGTESKNFEYAGSNDINAVAWTSANSGSNAHPVGQKEANELGLYDMSGNVFEWCNDWYDENYYGKSPGNDPKGPATGPHRVIRGGNWASEPAVSRVAHRIPNQLGYGAMGFRLASSL
ncbi:SUMF1/EgtB/PvdO family nonheme iron enzyme [Algoriphagus sp. D3-2-R+10]|uniref:SUMF1/EgtB/PvdO family nonheme iron enzyme n=1 Tax=Algoriphagus aurantiacus TaxID=3103948 RepID=UPI002B3FF2DE|nr:SUMF1/EgtB/PvdO family nonheme iron enzyme [Algoriphagus sp. D3-2-R+10]MEB2774308.1 SUMF1/EgtB/PvdO family nonheme iron enzyme [Algoriphagus sp. D3-2-R+10]